MLNIYRASAGSGKTYRLTRDYIRLLFASSDLQRAHRRILAVTFTNKATEEMKSRILHELYALSTNQKSNYRDYLMKEFSIDNDSVNKKAKSILIHLLHDYSSFSVSTIDTFFQQVLRSFAREIGIDGGYNLELDTDYVLSMGVDSMYQDLTEEKSKDLLHWMTSFAEDNVEQGRSWKIRNDILKLGKEIFKESYQKKIEETNEKLHDKTFLRGYIKQLKKIKTDFEEKIAALAENSLEIVSNFGLSFAEFKGKKFENYLKKLINNEFSISSTLVSYAESVENCYTNKSTPSETIDKIIQVYENGLGKNLKAILEMLSSEIVTYNSAIIILKNMNMLGILSDLGMYVKQLMSDQNTLLLSDTNLLLNRIIGESETPFIYERTGINVDHFMIDEFQDTSLLQWNNFRPLIKNSLGEDKENMIVGDVKQSIYRWRNSDWNLLDEDVNSDFLASQTQEEVLGVNWRTDKNIIDFNNDFFQKSSSLLFEKFEEKITENIVDDSGLDFFAQKIKRAYKDVAQNVSDRAGEGYTRIEFVTEKKKEDATDAVLSKIPPIIENLVDRGYALSDIAILVRYGKEAVSVMQSLMEYAESENARSDISYNVIGNEGVLLSSSKSVEFLVALLSVIENSENDVQRFLMNYNYLQILLNDSEEVALRKASSVSAGKEEIISPYFSNEENEFIKNSRNNSLFELTEKIIKQFKLAEKKNEIIYLQAFQDVVFDFVKNKNSDLHSFLNWWENYGIKKTVNTPENQDAIKVMTIHKSKGLEFKVVIVPFANWDIYSKSLKTNYLWLQTDVEPYSQLPLIPVKFESKMEQSVFAKDYYEELMYQYVDNLNLAYVAFTRAKSELYCFGTYKSVSKTNKNTRLQNIDNISNLLQEYFMPDSFNYEAPEDEGGLIVEIGKPVENTVSEKKKVGDEEKIKEYPVVLSDNRLKIKPESNEQWKEDKSLIDSPLNYGLIMHDVLRQVSDKDEVDKIITELKYSGKVNDEEAGLIAETMQKFWELPNIDRWFFADGKILNETTILLPDGSHFRPDRVVVKDKKAIITDYKFGTEQRPSHKKQIHQYEEILHQMNYETESYLVYVTMGEVISM